MDPMLNYVLQLLEQVNKDKKRVKQVDIAKRANVSPSMVSMVLKGKCKSKPVLNAAIACVLAIGINKQNNGALS